MNTSFKTIYDRFLGKITDDMYVELTPEDTLKDIQSILLNSLHGFEFPRFPLEDYTLEVITKKRGEIIDGDFVTGIVWHELDNLPSPEEEEEEYVYVDDSTYNFELTSEEIDIIATLMMCNWVQRQVTSIENTRMKYSGSDFKMTSQANHLQKLITLLNECQRQSHHMQRLYKRRRLIQNENSPYNGMYRSNWDVLGRGIYYDRYGC